MSAPWILPVLLKDGYKVGHPFQYVPQTRLIYSNMTARASRVTGWRHLVPFALQYFNMEYLQRRFTEDFFERDRGEVLRLYKRRIDNYLGPDAVPTKHIGELHEHGCLPLRVKAVPEGTLIPLRVPWYTIVNTETEFFWLTNMVETIMSNVLWLPATSATTAFQYRRSFERYAEATGADKAFVKWQGHDFSFRGMAGLEAALLSGAAHLLSFTGTDTIPAIDFLEYYYGANSDTELVGGSVPATEHSVMSMGRPEGEFETFHRLLTQVYPKGIVSVVSDTWDFFNVVANVLPELKDVILARDGKLVIRPDSGDPVKIICGDIDASSFTHAWYGAIALLWRTFGGTVTDKGYKVLDPHVGLIYGDSITRERQEAILGGLQRNGFASSNVVLGVGSYCVASDTPVLCSDLTWREAGRLEVGQQIIAFDENPSFREGRKASRRYKVATIEENRPATKACLRVVTDGGQGMTASVDHPWLVIADNRSQKNMFLGATPKNLKGRRRGFPRSSGLAWKRTSELRPGDRLAFMAEPWHRDETRDGGWLAGIFDGEGSLSRSTGDTRIPAWKVNVSQNDGHTLARIRAELSRRGFSFYENYRPCVALVLTGGWIETLRFLGVVDPDRLREKLPLMLEQMPALRRNDTYKVETVRSVYDAGVCEVASIRTSSGTFVTAGFLTHNTYQYVTRDTYGLAIKATYGETDQGGRDLFKAPKTDDGTKNSACGLLRVDRKDGGLCLTERCSWPEEQEGELRTVFEDGQIPVRETLAGIRARIEAQL